MFMEYKADLESEHNMRATCSRAQFIYRIVNIRLSGDDALFDSLLLSVEYGTRFFTGSSHERAAVAVPAAAVRVYTRKTKNSSISRALTVKLYYSTVRLVYIRNFIPMSRRVLTPHAAAHHAFAPAWVMSLCDVRCAPRWHA